MPGEGNAVCGAGLLSVEPFTEADVPLSRKELTTLMSVADIFSPNLAEAASMLGRRLDPAKNRYGPGRCLHWLHVAINALSWV